MLYFDTNVFHLLREALAGRELPEAVRRKIMLSPLSAMEVLSQLTLRQTKQIHESIRTMHSWLPIPATILAWPDHFAAKQFGINLPDDPSQGFGEAINTCLQADSIEELRQAAHPLKEFLDKAKLQVANSHQAFIEEYKRNPVRPSEFETAFAQGWSANRLAVKPGTFSDNAVVGAFSAYFEYKTQVLLNAAGNKNYDFRNNLNDALDVEQLVYLADPANHFLTCDTGFRRIQNSDQRERIHIAEHSGLANYDEAMQVLQRFG